MARPLASELTGRALAGYALAKVGPGLLTFASVPIWVRGVGLDEYATFSQVWALVVFTGSLSVGWLRQGALRLAGDPTGALRLLPRWALVAAVLVPVAPVEAWLLVMAGRPQWTLMAQAALFCAASGAYGIASIRSVRDQRSTLFAGAELARVALGLLAWFALYRWAGLAGAAGVLAGASAGTLAATALLLAPDASELRRAARPSGPGRLGFYWRFGVPMSLWLAVASALVYLDRFVVALFLGQAAAGQYVAVADMIVRGMGILAFPVSLAVYPAVMSAWNAARRDRVSAILGSASRTLAVLLAAGVIGCAAVGPWILGAALSGPPPGTALVGVLAVGAALWQFALLAHKPLEIAERGPLMLRLIVVSVVVTAALDAVLVPAWGLPGAAAGFTAGAAAYTIACVRLGPRVLGAYALVSTRAPR